MENFTEQLQLQESYSYLIKFDQLKKFYVKAVKKVKNRFFKDSDNKSRKSNFLWHMYSFPNLSAPTPKESKINLKNGEVHKI